MDNEIKEKGNIINEEYRKEGPEIIRDLVVGFLIVKSKVKDGASYINIVPLDTSWDGFNDDSDVDPNEDIVGIIPAPQGSYKILGLFPRKDDKEGYPDTGSYETLGYEYNGVYHPDWKELLEEKIKKKQFGKLTSSTILTQV